MPSAKTPSAKTPSAKASTAKTLTAKKLAAALKAHADPAKARLLARFFKTGAGEYGEGDVFWGVTVPGQRVVARQFSGLPLAEISELLKSPVHELRLTALIVLVRQYERSDQAGRQGRFDFYLRHLHYVNNWDLVDSSARQIVGEHLLEGDRAERQLLYRLARSANLWERRVAIIASSAFINAGDASHTLALAEILLDDSHDLIHKAVGWMLREVGKRVGRAELLGFLDRHAHRMPRTALRYAIEHLSEQERQTWLGRKADGEARRARPSTRQAKQH